MVRNYLAVILCLGSVSAATAETEKDFGGVPNARISYYPVSGNTAAKIRASIDRSRPVDPADKKSFDGLTNYKFSWTWPVDGNGKCHLDQAKVEFQATVTLPRLTNNAALPASLQKRWDLYDAVLKEHELGHVRLAFAQKEKLLKAIRGATCDSVNEVAAAILAKTAELNQEYDKKTQHGQAQGVTFP